MVAQRHLAHQSSPVGLVFLRDAPGSSSLAFSSYAHSHRRLVSQIPTHLLPPHRLCPRISVDEHEIPQLTCQSQTSCVSRTCGSDLGGHPILRCLVVAVWFFSLLLAFPLLLTSAYRLLETRSIRSNGQREVLRTTTSQLRANLEATGL